LEAINRKQLFHQQRLINDDPKAPSFKLGAASGTAEVEGSATLRLTAVQQGVEEHWEIVLAAKSVSEHRKQLCRFDMDSINKIGGVCDELEMQRMQVTHERKLKLARMCRGKTEKDNTTVELILASAPCKDQNGVEVLSYAAALVGTLNGTNCAGDVTDAYHQQMLPQLLTGKINANDKKHKPFRSAWRSRVAEATSMLRGNNKAIVLLAIQGGPECNWEQIELNEIYEHFRKEGVDISIQHCQDLDDLYNYLVSTAVAKASCTIS